MAILSSHILDSLAGDHACGIRVACYGLMESSKQLLFDVIANEEGRISESIATHAHDAKGQYELVFHAADYFHQKQNPRLAENEPIMPQVVLRITLPNPESRYHIPLVLSPHSYTVWWSG